MKKTIAFFHPVDDKYGASNILAYIIRILAKDNICHVYIPLVTGEMENTIDLKGNENIKFISMPELPVIHRGMYSIHGVGEWLVNNVSTYKFLSRIKNDYDFMYINTVSLFSIAVLTKLLGKENITHCHEYLAGSIYGKIIKFFVTNFSDEVISVSAHVNSYISNGNPKCKVVRNGVPDLIDGAVNKGLIIDENYMHFSLVGRVMPEKGHWFLLNMLKALPDEIRLKLKIHVFGDSPPTRKYLMDEFKHEIIRLGLGSTVISYGFDPEAAVKISNMDVCLIPSMMADPFPTTVLEAIRAGKTVITTNHGGAKEVISHGVNGYLISPGDIEEFRTVVTNIVIQGRDKNKVIGDAARELFTENYTIEKFQERFKSVLEKFLY